MKPIVKGEPSRNTKPKSYNPLALKTLNHDSPHELRLCLLLADAGQLSSEAQFLGLEPHPRIVVTMCMCIYIYPHIFMILIVITIIYIYIYLSRDPSMITSVPDGHCSRGAKRKQFSVPKTEPSSSTLVTEVLLEVHGAC